MAVHYIQASGKDVAELVDRIEDAVNGAHTTLVAIACIVVAALAQNPDLNADKLQELVKGVTEYMAAAIYNESSSGAVN